jgi:hypothetical protein
VTVDPHGYPVTPVARLQRIPANVWRTIQTTSLVAAATLYALSLLSVVPSATQQYVVLIASLPIVAESWLRRGRLKRDGVSVDHAGDNQSGSVPAKPASQSDTDLPL